MITSDDDFGGPLLLRPDTDLSSVNFYIFLSNLGLHESTVGVALGSHIAERKRVRAHGVRKSVFYSTYLSDAVIILGLASFVVTQARPIFDGGRLSIAHAPSGRNDYVTYLRQERGGGA